MMTGNQLKNTILQEAIEGRLVPQDSNDEPASVLLDKIRKEKARLVKDGKLKKKDLEETPIADDEKPFEIPESWEWCRLNDICIFLSRGKSPTYSAIPNEYPVFAQKCNLKDGGISLEQAKFLNSETVSKWQEEYRLRTDDVLVNSTGTGTVCRTRLFHERYLGNYPFTVPDSHVSVVRTSKNINSAFIFNLFNSKFYQDYWEDRLAGSTNQKELYIGVLQNTLIPLPPLSEQHRIVAKIEELMPKVEEYGKAQEALDKLNEELPEKLKKSILQEAISGRLGSQDPNDEPASVLLDKIRKEKARLVKEGKLKKKDLEETPIEEDEKPFEIPESWEWVRVGAIFNHSSGKQLSGSNTDGALHEYITTSNLYWGRFELENLKSMYYKDSELEKCTAKQGDLLVCEGGDIGRCAIWPYDYDICLQNHIHRLRPFDNSYTVFVFYIMWYYKSIGLIGGKGIGIQGLSASALKSIVIPLPPLSEQHRIVQKIEELFKEIDKLKQ